MSSSSEVPVNGEAADPAMAPTLSPPTAQPPTTAAASTPSVAPSGAKRRKQQKTNRVPQEPTLQQVWIGMEATTVVDIWL